MPKVQPPELKKFMDKKLSGEDPTYSWQALRFDWCRMLCKYSMVDDVVAAQTSWESDGRK